MAVNREEAARHVVDTLRRRVWLGGRAARDVSLNQPLGSDGLGLDSLGVVEFLVGLEGSLDVRFPDEFWSRGPRTVGDVVDFIAAAGVQTVAEPPAPAPHSAPPGSARLQAWGAVIMSRRILPGPRCGWPDRECKAPDSAHGSGGGERTWS